MGAKPRKIRAALFSTRERLREEIDVAEISISLLVRRAGVGGPTFYQYFDSVDAMLEEQLRDGLNEQPEFGRSLLKELPRCRYDKSKHTRDALARMDFPRRVPIAGLPRP